MSCEDIGLRPLYILKALITLGWRLETSDMCGIAFSSENTTVPVTWVKKYVLNSFSEELEMNLRYSPKVHRSFTSSEQGRLSLTR